VRTRGCAP